jgi:protein-disulfide isomerase
MAKTSQPAPRNEKAAEARKKAQAQVKAEQRRTTILWIVGAVVVVGVFAALIAFIVRQDAVGEIDGENQLTPEIATAEGGFPVGSGGVVGEDLDPERAQLAVYLDFMCPVCGAFEEINGAEIAAMSEEGIVDVTYHPISILDHTSLGTNYSTRSASAAALVAEESPELFVGFLTALFANQPEENTRGLNDAQIQEIARGVGVPEETVAKIPDYSYSQWVGAATEKASIAGVSGTPTIFINGENRSGQGNPDAVNWSQPGALRAAIEAANAE